MAEGTGKNFGDLGAEAEGGRKMKKCPCGMVVPEICAWCAKGAQVKFAGHSFEIEFPSEGLCTCGRMRTYQEGEICFLCKQEEWQRKGIREIEVKFPDSDFENKVDIGWSQHQEVGCPFCGERLYPLLQYNEQTGQFSHETITLECKHLINGCGFSGYKGDLSDYEGGIKLTLRFVKG